MTDTEYLYLSPECTEDILSEPKGFVNENARFSQSGRPLKPVPKAGRLSFHTGISNNTQPIGHRRIGAVFSRQENIYTSAFNTPHCLCVQQLSRYLPYPAGYGYRLGVRHRCRRLPCYPPADPSAVGNLRIVLDVFPCHGGLAAGDPAQDGNPAALREGLKSSSWQSSAPVFPAGAFSPPLPADGEVIKAVEPLAGGDPRIQVGIGSQSGTLSGVDIALPNNFCCQRRAGHRHL